MSVMRWIWKPLPGARCRSSRWTGENCESSASNFQPRCERWGRIWKPKGISPMS